MILQRISDFLVFFDVQRFFILELRIPYEGMKEIFEWIKLLLFRAPGLKSRDLPVELTIVYKTQT